MADEKNSTFLKILLSKDEGITAYIMSILKEIGEKGDKNAAEITEKLKSSIYYSFFCEIKSLEEVAKTRTNLVKELRLEKFRNKLEPHEAAAVLEFFTEIITNASLRQYKVLMELMEQN